MIIILHVSLAMNDTTRNIVLVVPMMPRSLLEGSKGPTATKQATYKLAKERPSEELRYVAEMRIPRSRISSPIAQPARQMICPMFFLFFFITSRLSVFPKPHVPWGVES